MSFSHTPRVTSILILRHTTLHKFQTPFLHRACTLLPLFPWYTKFLPSKDNFPTGSLADPFPYNYTIFSRVAQFKQNKSCCNSISWVRLDMGRTTAQAVSRWLPTAAARVWSRVWLSGICGGQNGAGVGFLRVLRFPCQSSFHQLLHNHPHLSSGASTIGQKWPQYKGLSPTPLAIKRL
jgi:hypothetical protein